MRLMKLLNDLRSVVYRAVRLDFSVFRKRKEELQYLQQRVSELEKNIADETACIENVKSQFLKNLYHEIRTPLNAIIGFSEIIQTYDHPSANKDIYYNHIKSSSVKFLEIIDHLVEAAFIQSGLLEIKPVNFNLHELCTELYIHYSLHKHIAEKNIALLLNIPRNYQNISVTSDSYRISQILSILLSNAFKYTDKGIVEFGCSIQENMLEFYVKDTGIGGLQGQESKIFDSFSKLNNSDTSDEGLGLGLHLSKNIIGQMGGEIWFDSVKDVGTTVFFTLPYIPAATASVTPIQHEQAKTTTRLLHLHLPKAAIH